MSLTDEELAKIKDMKATAAIVMHYGGNDWSRAQIAGLKEQFGKAVQGKQSFAGALHQTQNLVVKYAKEQGFTVE